MTSTLAGQTRLRMLRDYFIAFALVAATFLLRQRYDPVLGTSQPYYLFALPVLLVAWACGFWPSIFALLMGLFLGTWFFAEPRHSLWVASTQDRIAATVHVVVSFGFCCFGYLVRVKQLRAERAMREQLRQSELLAITLASIGDAVVVTDAQGAITSLNREAERLTGWKNVNAARLPLMDVCRIVGAKTRQPVENPFVQARRQGGPLELGRDSLLLARTGAEIWIAGSAAPMRDAGGSTFGSVLVFRDVTDRKRASDALEESRRRLEFALAAGRMGAWEWDITSGEFFGSAEFEAIRGLAPGSFGGRFSDFKRDIHRDDVESVLAEMQRAVDARRDYHAVYRLQRSDGEDRWVEAFGKIATGPDGQPQKLTGICMDITERHRTV